MSFFRENICHEMFDLSYNEGVNESQEKLEKYSISAINVLVLAVSSSESSC